MALVSTVNSLENLILEGNLWFYVKMYDLNKLGVLSAAVCKFHVAAITW